MANCAKISSIAAKTTNWVLMGIKRSSFSRGGIWVIFLLGFGLLIKLGFWQLSRMTEKKAIEWEWRMGQQTAPVPLLRLLSTKANPKNYQAVQMPSLSLLPQIFLLDNQRQGNQAGYRIFYVGIPTPPVSSEVGAFLIEGDWLSYAEAAEKKDYCKAQYTELVGYIRFPSRGLQLSAEAYQYPVRWPLVLQWLDMAAIGRLMDQKVAPFWIAFDKPQLISLSPEKHLAYAIQWFLFSGLWAGYGIFLICRPQKGVS